MLKSSKLVWDLPTRLFHWTLVALVTLLWVTGEFGGLDLNLDLPLVGQTYLSNMDVHALAGQGVFILILFRLLWGIWGSTTSRFSHFVKSPKAIAIEASELVRGRVPESTGHNPLGGAMVVALILLLLAQSLSGLFSSDDLFYEAPLASLVSSDTSDMVTGWHSRLFGILEILILIHIAAIGYYLLRGKNLISAMITGRKTSADSQPLSIKPLWLGAIGLAISIGILLILRSFTE
jgi:cytochrome b